MELSSYLSSKFDIKKKGPPHSKAASVDEIIKLVGENRTYNYTYWLRKIGIASYGDVLGIIKQASDLPKGYSRGGFITNRLKLYAIKTNKTGLGKNG